MKNFHRHIFVLCAAFCFAVGVFSASAQTKSSVKGTKAAPPKTQKVPAKPAAKPIVAATKKPLPKTADKSKTSNAAKTKSADKLKTAAKSSTEKNKTAANSKEKAVSAKSSAKSAAKPATIIAQIKKPIVKSPAATSSASTKQTTAEKTAVNSKPTPRKTVAASSSLAIVSTTSARVRNAPNANANVVSTVNVGRVFNVVEENSGWYLVKLSDDKSGWISKQIAVDFSDAKREDIYRKIAAKYAKSKMDFADAAQTFDFLKTAESESKKPGAQGDFALSRLRTLSAALKAIPAGKGGQNPYKDFLNANEKTVVYSEPSAEWYVRSDVFWETHAKYKETAAGEEIAWLAAQTPLPGECEGYVNCYIYLLRVTDGEYLNFYPNGKYARKSIQNITSLLDPIVADLKSKIVYTAASDISDRAEFNRLLTELRAIISKVPYAEKAKAVQQINQIGEGFR